MDELELLAHLIGKHFPDPSERAKLLQNLYRGKPDEIVIIANVMKIKDAQRSFREILSGAHVTIFDLASRYDAWKVLKSARTRSSSHRSDGPQYHVDGPFCHTILFGKRGSLTWLQLENHTTSGVRQFIGHSLDFIKYQGTHKNQGPYGSSQHTDNRPLHFNPQDQKVEPTHQTSRWFRMR